MNKKVLVIVPTFNRAKALEEMLTSCLATKSPTTKILVHLNDDDPQLDTYLSMVAAYPQALFVRGSHLLLAEAYNHYACMYRDEYDYVTPVNDDHVFITPLWDEKLVGVVERNGGWGCAGADDKLTDWKTCKNPSGCVISTNIVKTLGYLIYPKIQHFGIDLFFVKVFEKLGILYLTKDVMIEHRHFMNGCRPMDSNYRWVYSKDQLNTGRDAMQEYLEKHFENDVAKLKEAMGK